MRYERRRKVPVFRRTKIIVTLGPASDHEETLRRLIEAGADITRLNFSHDDHESHAARIATVRLLAKEAGRVVAVMQDLQGPRIRTGLLVDGHTIVLHDRQTFVLTTKQVAGTAERVSTNFAALPKAVEQGDPVLINDGLIQLLVDEVNGSEVRCTVVHGGRLAEHKGINLPHARTAIAGLTNKDREDLRFGLAHGVDMVALSFVSGPEDAREARRIIADSGQKVPLLAKIERPQALERLDAILRAFDGVMVARGDLAIEVSAEMVPVAQKRIIERANVLGKPVIIATQMLDSMTRNPSPTRAEASDVANAVIDGADAVMLSGETAIGKYPVAAVEAMDRIAREAETLSMPAVTPRTGRRTHAMAVCDAAATLVRDLEIDAIAAYTRSGRTAQLLSKLRPPAPIFAMTEREAVARQLALWRGVVPLAIKQEGRGEEMFSHINRELQARGLVDHGGLVVVIGTAPQGPPGHTNFIRLLHIDRGR
jgi:pyruvate kinase